MLQKTGIAKAKKYKNRIYLRKKGDNKNRKKKDFFPPVQSKEVDDIIIGAGCAPSFCASQNTVL